MLEKMNTYVKRTQMQDLKQETIAMFEKFCKEYPELIDYRIKFGNVYEKAQAILIKSVAGSVLQNTAAAKQLIILQNTPTDTYFHNE
jgi:hypothetical protein